MNSCKMILRIFLTLIVMLSFMSSLAYAAKVDPKPATLQSIGAGNTTPGSLKATKSTTPIEKNTIDQFDETSKVAPRISHPGLPEDAGRLGILTEGFEGTVPPSGWSTVVTNSGFTWEADTYAPHSGLQNATVLYDYTQDEWMISPVLNFATANANLNVSFWWNASYYWAVTPYNNYNIEVWISTDGGATFPTKLWDEDSYGVFTSWVWNQTTIPLASYVGQTNVKLAWRYVGSDGAQASRTTLKSNAPPLVVTGTERRLVRLRARL
jgi:hypothetical protein